MMEGASNVRLHATPASQFDVACMHSLTGAGTVEFIEDVTHGNRDVDEKGEARIAAATADSDSTGGLSYTEAEERRVVKMMDMWIMPVLCGTFALAYWDKVLLGQSVLFGLSRDLDLTEVIGHDSNGNPITSSTRFSNVSWVLYLGYLFGAYPMSLLAQKYPTAKVCGTCMFVWSIIIMSTAACKNYSQLMINRFFLGVMESSIAPVFTVYVTFWWTRREQALRGSIWWGAAGIAMIFGPLMSYGLGHIHGDSGSSWKYIYLVAGSISMLWSWIFLWVLPDDPHRAKWLSPRNRAIILARLNMDNSGTVNRQFVAAQFWEALTDFNLWSNAFLLGGGGIPNGSISTFSGLVISGFGFDAFTSVLLLAPAGVLATISSVTTGYVAMRYQGWRYYIMAIFFLPALVGSFIDWLGPRDQKVLLYLGVIMLPIITGPIGMVTGLTSSNTRGHTKKATVSAANFLGYAAGNIAGPLAFASTPGPRYSGGFISCVAFLIALISVTLFGRWYLGRENARRDREYGPPSEEIGLEDTTDKENKNFRYMI